MQTERDFEIVVSDDCSTEDLKAVAESFGDSRIRYDRSDARLRAAKNHQRAVLLSRGEYVVNFNSDDLMLPRFLEVTGTALDAAPNAAAAYAAMAVLDQGSVKECFPVPRIGFADETVFRANDWLEGHHQTTPSSCLFRRKAFDRVGGYRTHLRLAYDWDLYMRFMRRGGGVVFLPNVLVVYRRHDEQLSQDVVPMGLYDMLDLWSETEYNHWHASDLAALVLTQVIAAVRARSGLLNLLRDVRASGKFRRLLPGLGPAALQRLLGRRAPEETRRGNYGPPSDIGAALTIARAVAEQ